MDSADETQEEPAVVCDRGKKMSRWAPSRSSRLRENAAMVLNKQNRVLVSMPLTRQESVNLYVSSRLPLDMDFLRQYVPLRAGSSEAAVSVDICVNVLSDAELGQIRGNVSVADYAAIQEAPGLTRLRKAEGSNTFMIVHDLRRIVRVHFHNSGTLRTLPSHVEMLLSASDAKATRQETMLLRLYKDVLQHYLHLHGFCLVHCSVASKDGCGIVFVGRRGAGKSAWLLRCLRHGYSFVANDRAFVNPATREAVAYPLCARVSEITGNHFGVGLCSNALAGKLVTDVVTKKILLLPREVSSAFGVDYEMTCRAGRMLVLRPTDEGNEEEHVELCRGGTSSEAVYSIRENLYYPSDPNYAFDVYCRPICRNQPPQAITLKLFRSIETSLLHFDWATFDRDFHRTLPLAP